MIPAPVSLSARQDVLSDSSESSKSNSLQYSPNFSSSVGFPSLTPSPRYDDDLGYLSSRPSFKFDTPRSFINSSSYNGNIAESYDDDDDDDDVGDNDDNVEGDLEPDIVGMVDDGDGEGDGSWKLRRPVPNVPSSEN